MKISNVRLFIFTFATLTNAFHDVLSYDYRLSWRRIKDREKQHATQKLAKTVVQSTRSSLPPSTIETIVREYEYDGWKLTYRYRPATKGYENEPPLFLIHPVGIGLVWDRMMTAASNGPAMIAPNLIGCGISEGSAEWDPDKRGLFVPLDWVKGCEALLRHIQENEDFSSLSRNSLDNTPLPAILFKSMWSSFNRDERKWTVISQGGLAPIAVLLAARNPNLVGNIVMASPPQWKEMTTPVPEKILAKNLSFFKGFFGGIAFDVLERRGTISLFSNIFLFSNPCDDVWLDSAEREMGEQARQPVAVFNAGFTFNKSLERELLDLGQPTLIVQGQDDARTRDEYCVKMKKCTIKKLPGKNVIPWEYPSQFLEVVLGFISKSEVPQRERLTKESREVSKGL
ncbi:hypothetical protein IV203_003248 [Nitzschia inconspicua]|uniref:AB hydrolase-1 domain-containing protein n=1 Tax=Nitzschia inconspicua TaxID=303405 RepID=A0A9K3PNI8_9STRA|nr:hypothetical protein IV203_003248 [Nitzschia inconspicua]